MYAHKVLCLDLGGTSLKCGLVKDMRIDKRYRIATDVSRGADGIVDTFRAALSYYRDEDYTAVAVSSAGTIDSGAGTVTYATSLLPGYTGFPVKRFFERETARPCVCLNDGHAAALCESAAFAEQTTLVLTLGTGVGGAYVENGNIADVASEGIGHITLEENGRPCTCGRRGCIEQYVSGTALHGNGKAEPQAFWLRYTAGDEETVATVTDWLAHLRAACDLLHRRHSFDVAIFGGGVSDSGALWLDGKTFCDAPYRVALARYGNDAGMLGAYLYGRSVGLYG